LGEIFQVKPFVEVRDGEVLRLGQVRTRGKGIKKLVDKLENLGPLERLAILHTNAPEDAYRFYDALKNAPAQEPVFINVTSVIGTHVGPNGLGFAAVLA
jgi:fatty acid-binding protein DegV